jgi:hypothetical protein
MKTKQAFEVAVRVIGMILIILAVIYILDACVMLYDPTFRSKPAWHYLVDGGMLVPIGLYLLRGASHIIRFAFRDEHLDDKPDA